MARRGFFLIPHATSRDLALTYHVTSRGFVLTIHMISLGIVVAPCRALILILNTTSDGLVLSLSRG